MTETSETGSGPRATVEAPLQRTISPISGRLGRGGRGGLVMLGGLALGGALLAATWRAPPANQALESKLPARQVVPFEPATSSPTLAAPADQPPSLTPDQAGPQVPALQPERGGPQTSPAPPPAAPLIVYQATGPNPPGGAAEAPEPASAAGPATELDRLRQASAVKTVQARRLPSRDFLILAGSLLPCVLQTAMSSATPGYVSCLIPRDVLSASGGVVLLEKGSQVLGEYRGGLQQGQTRLFVLWTRAVTPGGVAVTLSSPAADALGRSGFDGARDTHFWERFGGALLLSMVDQTAAGLAERHAGGDVTRLPSDTAGIALQSSLAIAPTLDKAQGSEVSIFVAQDLDFSSVYGLRAQ